MEDGRHYSVMDSVVSGIEFENKMTPTNGAKIKFEESLMGNELICPLLG